MQGLSHYKCQALQLISLGCPPPNTSLFSRKKKTGLGGVFLKPNNTQNMDLCISLLWAQSAPDRDSQAT